MLISSHGWSIVIHIDNSHCFVLSFTLVALEQLHFIFLKLVSGESWCEIHCFIRSNSILK